ncbi:carbohydrate ABC transporter permease [Cohnella hongkongensis]|uniref:Carbohydrate ABC transporter permease n=1 Tax=Cohnella hongkongensis TaxID=178337 RepID=A0ABV9F5Q0_9BACL
MRRKDRAYGYVYAVLTGIVLIVFAFPLIWMLLASFKTQIQMQSTSHFFIFEPTLRNYTQVFQENNFLKYMINSAIVAIGSTAGGLLLGLPAAYGIARFRMPGLALTILVARIVPGITFLIPWFILFSQLNLIDSYTALILAHMLVSLPFIIWVMIPFFESLPLEIEEAALIDGSTRAGVFLRTVIPISGPGIITSSLMSAIFSWNNFLFSLVLAGEKTKTLPIAIFNFISYSEVNWGGLMAAATVITLPIIVISLFAQRYVISGLSAGAVKG